MAGMTHARPLVDGFGRTIRYARLSLTDRCDLRCRYCMAEDMTFVPRAEVLTFEEIETLADALIARGVTKLRLTGGEPLVRRGVEDLIARLGTRLGAGLEELTLTTNGTRLAELAQMLAAAGVRRVNVSLDSRDPRRFQRITRRGALAKTIGGIEAASAAGIAIKINMVAMRGVNDDEIAAMLAWCVGEGHDLTLIEAMPLGEVDDDRAAQVLPLSAVLADLQRDFCLIPTLDGTGGPARYYRVDGRETRLGLITPLSENFCSGCNRIRVTATGRIYGCLGHEQSVDVRAVLRGGGAAALDDLLDRLVASKPHRHAFDPAAATPSLARHMSVTGG